MPTIFMADPALDKVAIYTGNDDDPLADPLGSIDRIKFHSDFGYLRIAREYQGTLTLPARGGPSGSWVRASQTIVANINTDPPVWMIPFSRGQDSGGDKLVQVTKESSTLSFRVVGFRLVNQTLSLEERYWTKSATLPAMSLPYRVFILSTQARAGGTALIDIDPVAGTLQLGGSLFDTDHRYLRQTNTSPEFYMFMERSADTEDAGGTAAKVWYANGQVQTDPGYAGTYAGPEYLGMDG